MQTYYTTSKCNGHIATTIIPLDCNTPDGYSRQLKLRTYKNNSELLTNASVHTLKDGLEYFIIFRDFVERIATSYARATAKAVQDQHETALANIHATVDAALKFYATTAT